MRTSLLTAALLVLPLVGCSGGGGGSGPATDASSSSSTSLPSEEPVEEAAATQITIGGQAYVPPCALLPPTEAAQLLPLTRAADVTERGRGASTTDKELADRKETVTGAQVTTSCDYGLGDSDNTQAQLRVVQFPTAAAATAEWRTFKKYGDGKLPRDLRDNNGVFDALEQATVDIIEDAQKNLGGVRLRGIDERILWQAGERAYIATTGNLFLGFTRGLDHGLTDDLTERDARLAERVLTTAIDRAKELRGEDAEPAVGSTGQMVQAEGWPVFLDPCALFDAEVVDILFPEVELQELTSSSTDADPDSNLALDSPAGRSVENSCQREDLERRHTAELLVQYVAPGDQPQKVLDSYLSNLAFQDPRPSPEQVRTIRGALRQGGMYDVDGSYVLASTGGGMYFYVVWDRYVLQLEAEQATKRRGGGSTTFPELETVDSYTLKTAMEAVFAHTQDALGSDG